MDLRNLRAFYFVGKYGSLLRAANYLKITSPAISIQLKKLEGELGVKLFERQPNKLILTEKGESLLNEVGHVFGALARLQQVAAQELHSGKLTIALGSDLPRYFAPRIAAFSQKHPTLRITILRRHAPEALSLLSEGTIDMAIGWFAKVPMGIQKQSLLNSNIVLISPPKHPLAKMKSISLASVSPFPLILHTRTTPTRRVVDTAFYKSAIEMDDILEVGTCDAIIEYVQLGLGVGFVHDTCVPKQGNIQSIDMRREFETMEVSVIYRKSAALKTWQQSFIAELR